MEVIWSGGGRYIVPDGKIATSAAIIHLPGGVKISWEDGTFDYFAGSVANQQSGNRGGWFVGQASEYCLGTSDYKIYRFNSVGSVNTSPIATSNNKATPPAIPFVQSGDINPSNNYSAGAIYNYRTITRCSIYREVNHQRYLRLNGGNSGFLPYLRLLTTNSQGFDLKPSDFIWIPVGTWYRVTSDLGEISERQTNAPPTFTDMDLGCAVRVSFSDGSSLDIPVSYCPTWARIVNNKECPPEACHQCEHDGIKCCYSLGNDGLFHLIDTFHL
jgi:hypothetical protein